MGFEVTFHYHPRKEEGGYDTEIKETTAKKVGQAFEEVPLEQLASIIMSQLARRDIFIFDVTVEEYIKQKISFKESKDGRGIVLKNKKFTVDNAAKLIVADVVEVGGQVYEGDTEQLPAVMPEQLPPGVQPHELMYAQQQMEAAYADPDKPMPVKRQNIIQPTVNKNRILYRVVFSPGGHIQEARKKNLKFTDERHYPVHAIRENPMGGHFGSLLTVTDDAGRLTEVDEKYFMPVGKGLYGDDELDFSGRQGRPGNVKLAFEDELRESQSQPLSDGRKQPKRGQPRREIPPELQGIPLDDGSIPDTYLEVPDIRRGRG